MAIVWTAWIAVTTSVTASDWPQFRGADGSGVSDETGLLESWPDQGPKQIWKTSIGQGFSAVSVVGEAFFTMYGLEAEEDKGEYVAAFSIDTGKELWRLRVGDYFVEEFGNGPRSTPTVANKVVYCLGSYGNLFAVAADSGERIWDIDVQQAFDAKMPRFGWSVSPLVHDGHLIVEVGGSDSKAFVALDVETGELIWAAEKPSPHGVGYNTPLMVEVHNQNMLVCAIQNRLVGLSPQGKTLWEFDGDLKNPAAMPVFVPPNAFFVSNVEKVGAIMVRLDEQEGSLIAADAWKHPTMRNNWSSSLTLNDHIYGFDQASLKCLSAKDGELKWVKRGFGKGSLIAVDNCLLVLTDRGHLVLAEAQPDAFHQLGRFAALKGKSWTAPAFADGRVYLRNLTEMACYQLTSDE